MHTDRTKLMITFIAGLAIGIAGMAILQMQQTPKTPLITKNAVATSSTPAVQGTINSAKDILVPSDVVEGVVQRVDGDLVIVNVVDQSTKTILETRTIKVFGDTELIVDGINNPSLRDISPDMNVSVSGFFNINDVLQARYFTASKK
ncbi:MAG: hypothetical protein Q8P11_00125 [bacterium]|nr:hypothetical protein [bacterium]